MKISKKILSILLTIAIVVNMISITAIPTSALGSHSISYRSHISKIGWQSYTSEYGVSGTTGQGIPMEAFGVEFGLSVPAMATIEYRAHVREYGWQNYVSNGATAGTTGQGKSIEAVQIRLVRFPFYNVYYRVHMQNTGWGNWVKNGEIAGTTGQYKPIEAIQIFIKPGAISERDTRVITDWNGVKQEATNKFYIGTKGFIDKFGIVFSLKTTTDSSVLSGACPNTDINNLCILNSNFCGLNCNNHHKGSSRLLDLLRTNTIYTCRIVQYRLCYINGSEGHVGMRGLAYNNDKDSLVSALASQYESTIQHELSHNLGVIDHCDTTTENEPCVMKKSGSPKREINKWCSNCSKKIK